MEGFVHVDGDFKTGLGNCRHHCSPTCHRGQIDENEWHYGCLHPAWPSNKVHDFCPFVTCGGDMGKCEIPKKLKSTYRRGLTVRINNLEKKLMDAGSKRDELDKLTNTD